MGLEHLQGRHVIECGDRLTWKRARQQFITASEAGALTTPRCGKHSRYSLYHSKRAEIPPERPTDYNSPGAQARLYGHTSEPGTAQVHAELTGRTLHDIGEWTIIGDAVEWGERSILSCTPDYLCDPVPGDWDLPTAGCLSDWHPTPDDGPGILQLKNVSSYAWGTTWADGVPDWILIQNLVEQHCAGTAWGSIVITVGGNQHYFYDQPARPKLAQAIRAEAAKLLDDISEGREPEIDDSEATADTLRGQFPETEEATLLLPPEAEERWVSCREAELAINQWTSIKRHRESWFRRILGSTQYGIIPNIGRANLFTNGHGGRTLRLPKKADARKAEKLARDAGLL